MANADKPGSEEWRLGIELGEHAEQPRHPEPEPAAGPDRVAARLDQPLYVLTAEHLGWLLIAAYTLGSRMLALGARPIEPAEARDALAALAVSHHGLYAVAHALSWVVLAQSGMFGALGASDLTVRLFAAICGMLLVATAFATRPYLGRAGALGFGAMLAMSPTLLWYSRAGDTAVPAAAFAMVAVALAMACARRPTVGRALGMGGAAALAISAGPVGAAAMVCAAAAAMLVGAYHAISGAEAILRIRVWWTRRATVAIVAVVAAVVVWAAFTTAFFTTGIGASLSAELAPLFEPGGKISFVRGLEFYAPIFSFYEFAIVLAAIIGLIAVVTVRVRSSFVAWAALWMALSAAAYVALAGHRPEFTVGVLVPMALLGAVGIDWLFRTAAWSAVRYAAVALAALTVYSQALTSVVYSGPDAAEAPWARHALLFWTEPATTWQTRDECAHAAKIAAGGTLAIASGVEAPAVQWYLRGLPSASDPSTATVAAYVPGPAPMPETAGIERSEFTLDQNWTPALSKLTLADAMRYLLAARAWTPVTEREIALAVRPPRSGASTAIVAPPALPSAAAIATPSATVAPTALPLPEAGSTESSSASPTSTSSSPPSPAPTPQAPVMPPPAASATPTASTVLLR